MEPIEEVMRLMFDYGFGELNLNKIWGEVYDNNDALESYKELGFSMDGVSRDSYFIDGKYGNSTIISLLQDEWFKRER